VIKTKPTRVLTNTNSILAISLAAILGTSLTYLLKSSNKIEVPTISIKYEDVFGDPQYEIWANIATLEKQEDYEKYMEEVYYPEQYYLFRYHPNYKKYFQARYTEMFKKLEEMEKRGVDKRTDQIKGVKRTIKV
jgi:hypothetical protein